MSDNRFDMSIEDIEETFRQQGQMGGYNKQSNLQEKSRPQEQSGGASSHKPEAQVEIEQSVANQISPFEIVSKVYVSELQLPKLTPPTPESLFKGAGKSK